MVSYLLCGCSEATLRDALLEERVYQHVPKQPEAFNHPLLGVELVDGQVPGVDLHDAGPGLVYVLSDEASADAEGAVAWRSGVSTAALEETASPKSPIADFFVPVLSSSISEQLEQLDPAAPVRVLITTARGSDEPITLRVMREIGLGNISSYDELAATREQLISTERELLAEVQSPIVDKIVDVGGAVEFQCTALPCVVAEVPAGALAELAAFDGVVRIGGEQGLQENSGGTELRAGSQITELVSSPGLFDGEGPSSNTDADDIWAAVVEVGRFRATHKVFNDTSTLSPRVEEKYCQSGCVAGNGGGAYSQHTMETAGTVLGDTEDGQIVGVTGVDGAGMAPEARAVLYRVSALTNMVSALDDIGNNLGTHYVHATSMSISTEAQPPYDCSGADDVSGWADVLFDYGSLLVMAAGNDGGSATACKVEVPGSAATTFTIGGHGSSNSYTETNVRTDPIHSSSAWGGNYNSSDFMVQGRGRTIIDMSAFRCVSNRPSIASDTGLGQFNCGTSFSAPIVAGAATDFVDFYRDTYSAFIDNPGALFVNLLLMGDRQGSPFTMSNYYNNRYGAGRLKARKFDDDGLDGPWVYQNGSVCVPQNMTVTLVLGGGVPFSSDIDRARAVAFWYDPFFVSGNAMDDIDLELYDLDLDATLIASASDYEEKERVYYDGVGGRTLALRFVGHTISSDYQCGTNSQIVHFAFVAEDSDREAGEGLGDVEKL